MCFYGSCINFSASLLSISEKLEEVPVTFCNELIKVFSEKNNKYIYSHLSKTTYLHIISSQSFSKLSSKYDASICLKQKCDIPSTWMNLQQNFPRTQKFISDNSRNRKIFSHNDVSTLEWITYRYSLNPKSAES